MIPARLLPLLIYDEDGFGGSGPVLTGDYLCGELRIVPALDCTLSIGVELYGEMSVQTAFLGTLTIEPELDGELTIQPEFKGTLKVNPC